MQFEFATATRIVFGPGKLKEIQTIAPALGKRAFLVTGRTAADPTHLQDFLCQQEMECEPFVVNGEPSVDVVKAGIDLARKMGADMVIAFGGGSVLDTGKAIAGMLTNPGDLLDYLEVVGKNQPLVRPGAPFVAIPTTAGTGSEVTRNAVLTVPEKKVKVSMRSPYLLARVAIVDPDLTVSVPQAVTASTGMDALTQVLEPYVSRRANVLTDLFCREGMARAARSLQKAYQQGDARQAREDMAWASLLGGLALANAGLGAVHGFAAPIGGMFDVPHGAVCACLLPAATAVNARALRERQPDSPALARYHEVAQILVHDQQAEIEDGIRWLAGLKAELKIPSLSTYGITSADLPELVDKGRQASSMKANPIDLTDAELLEILERSL